MCNIPAKSWANMYDLSQWFSGVLVKTNNTGYPAFSWDVAKS